MIMMNFYEQAQKNIRATQVIIVAFILLFLFIGLGFDFHYGLGARVPVFTIVALVFGGLSGILSFQYGDKFILASTHAKKLDLTDIKQRQWQNVVEEMSISAGIPLPAAYVIDDPDPNAFATGRAPKRSSIVVTKGLLDVLGRDELQGVAAHEMSHIRNFDIRLMLILAVLLGSVALIADWTMRSMFFRGSRRRGGNAAGGLTLIILALWLVAVILAPLLSRILAMFVSRRREYLADASAAELTRNPLGLASALEKIAARSEPTRSISRGTAHLCIADPKGGKMAAKEGRVADLFATHPPITKRIEVLRQMAYVK